MHGVALVLGSLGVFCLYCSCFGAHLAQYAIVCLGYCNRYRSGIGWRKAGGALSPRSSGFESAAGTATEPMVV